MTDQSHLHSYIERAKNRLDEIDASVAHFEARAQEVQSEARTKADAAIARMKANREAYRAWVAENQEIGDRITAEARKEMEAEWAAFEDNIMAYFDAAAGMYEQDKAYFQVRIAALKDAWEKTVKRGRAAARTLQVSSREEADTAVAKLEESADRANEKLKELNKAGSASWAAVREALTTSRTAFDKALDEAQKAFKKAV
ncbi:hypothetical protein [Sphingorhabdus sp. 109]|jgi:hypothetical protein|uniref:hypothetical protein n=1 Tax=Sphingorhabdus sp. 109 TaxID=2653173 RepID=UPI0012F1C90D|nr:hypothetical protein [Sphingorhabdus sp. 109]VWX60747.1 conserved hypothetical protein [Sphingorhabdus sp. 109]